MDFLHADFRIGPHDRVLVDLDGQANVMLLDDVNFSSYRRGQAFNYIGGWAVRTPTRLSPPHQGHWNVVIDLGGRAGQVKARISLVRDRLCRVEMSG